MSVQAVHPTDELRERATPTARPRFSLGGWAFTGASQALLLVWAVMVIFPFLWMIMTAFKTDPEILFSPWDLPSSLQWNNFARAWNEARIGRYVVNSLIVISGSLVGTLLFSAMTAYVLARFEFPGNRFIYYMFLAGMVFPVFLALVPLFFLVRDLHMTGTYHGLMLVYIAYSLPFTIFFLTGFFKSLPGEVAEAAIIDGASQFRVFFDVMLPMAKPGLVAMGIFNFLGQWNQFLLPLVLMGNEDRYMLSQGLAFLAIQQGYGNDYSALFAAMTITMIPSLLVYVLFQRRLESGLTAGALKG